MLFIPPDRPAHPPARTVVTEVEATRIVSFLKKQAKPHTTSR